MQPVTVLRCHPFALAVLAIFVSGPVAAACSSERVVGVLRDAVVKVHTDDGAQVSGVVVAHDHVVTVWHGLAGATEIDVVLGQHRHAATLLHADSDSDLALLAVPTGAVKPATLLHRQLEHEELVWVYGWPAGRWQTVGEGMYLGRWQGALRVSSLVEAGQSGGALIACEDDREMIAGLVTGFGAAELGGSLQRLPYMSLAVPAAELLQFFERSGVFAFQRESEGN